MSRSNPTTNNPNPSTRWFEWKGSEGKLVWYDKELKENIEAPKNFRFLVLDQLSTVKGYNKKAQCGIYSNEVRNNSDTLIVKFYDGDVIAEGTWNAIKESVVFKKGAFAKSVYIAFKDGETLKIGNICMKGSSLGPWFDFTKKHGKELDTKAVAIKAGEKDTTGDVDFIPPVFSILDTTEETNQAAVALDQELQTFLEGYFKRTHVDNVDQRTGREEEPEGSDGGHPNPPPRKDPVARRPPPPDPDLDAPDDDIPF